MKTFKSSLKRFKFELIIFSISLLFSLWLMFSTFSYQNGEMQIASKAWSDFASHLPLIRSFSLGDNFIPQYPLFSGPPIKYHFLFYAFVGMIEKIGVQIDYALNIPSAIGFSSLILMIYLFSKEIFKSKAVGIISIFLFLFNGSLSFVSFFSNNPISLNSFSKIISSNEFISFGPYKNDVISAFWNLNIYTNQRHLALSYAISLLLVYLLIRFNDKEKKINLKKSTFIGVILGFLFILNMAVFLMTIIILSALLLLKVKSKIYLIIPIALGVVIALPQYLFTQSQDQSFRLMLNLGYLVKDLNIQNFINYWLQNLGLHLFLIPLGVIVANKISKKIFISFFILFIVGNLIQFSPEIAANHKFFNYFMIIGVMYSSYFLLYLWKRNLLLKPIVIFCLFFITLSGILDFFPILNDNKVSIADYPKNKNISWIIKNTNSKSVFLNTEYLYNSASLAGRKIFLGWPYFAWSQGYDTLKRDNIRKDLLNASDLSFFCDNALEYNLDYIEISSYQKYSQVNKDFFEKNFLKVYENKKDGFIIYEIRNKCTI